MSSESQVVIVRVVPKKETSFVILNLLINKISRIFFMNCLRLYFIYEYSSISITYYATEILVYKFVIYKGLEFWFICLNESVIDQEWVT